MHAGLPEDVRHTLPRLQGVRGRRGGDRPGQDLPSQLLCLYHLQVSEGLPAEKRGVLLPQLGTHPLSLESCLVLKYSSSDASLEFFIFLPYYPFWSKKGNL